MVNLSHRGTAQWNFIELFEYVVEFLSSLDEKLLLNYFFDYFDWKRVVIVREDRLMKFNLLLKISEGMNA